MDKKIIAKEGYLFCEIVSLEKGSIYIEDEDFDVITGRVISSGEIVLAAKSSCMFFTKDKFFIKEEDILGKMI